jgi:Ser/Thr protein kinase RdoA (MazF antagonist)
VRLTLLAHLENTTFRVDAHDGGRFVLRVHRATGAPLHPRRGEAEVRSELLWLDALRREAGLTVPEPVPTRDGAPLVVAEVPGVPAARVCVLLRWVAGRFVDAGLTPAHLARVGRFMARLHAHAAGFTPPAGFERPRVGAISEEVRAYVAGPVAEHVGREGAALLAAVLDRVGRARRALGEGPAAFGLIHGDLHQENYLFDGDRVGAIDFDDCGWGHHLLDFAVVLSELRGRPDHAALRDGLLRGYQEVRPLPEGYGWHLPAFLAMRELQLTLWFLEQRHHPGFEEWEEEVRGGLDELRAFAARLDAGS